MYNFCFRLIYVKRILTISNILSKMLQQVKINFSDVNKLIDGTIKSIKSERNDIKFNECLESAAELFGIDIDELDIEDERNNNEKRRRENNSNDCKLQLKNEYFDFIDTFIVELETRFTVKQKLVYSAFSELSLYKNVEKVESNDDLNQFCAVFELFQMSYTEQLEILAELNMFKITHQTEIKACSDLADVFLYCWMLTINFYSIFI